MLKKFSPSGVFTFKNYQIGINFLETLIDKIPILIKLHCSIVLHRDFAESSGKQIKFMSETPAETNNSFKKPIIKRCFIVLCLI